MPKRVLAGRVTSDKMDKTVTVLVDRRVMHPIYKKFIRQSTKFAAHDEANTCKVGDLVRIEECPPISKRKTWLVIERNGQPLAAQAVGAGAAGGGVEDRQVNGVPVRVASDDVVILLGQHGHCGHPFGPG